MKLIHNWRFDNLYGDIFGGITAAIVALPLALAFGVQSGAGPVAGLYGAIALGIFAAIFGGTSTQISGPTGPMTVVSALVVIKAIEEDLKITNCNGIDYGCKSANNRNSKCLTHNLWHELKRHMLYFLDSVSIEDVRENNFFGKDVTSVDKPNSNNQINA